MTTMEIIAVGSLGVNVINIPALIAWVIRVEKRLTRIQTICAIKNNCTMEAEEETP